MYKIGFGLAGWNSAGNCYYTCWETVEDITDVSLTAS